MHFSRDKIPAPKLRISLRGGKNKSKKGKSNKDDIRPVVKTKIKRNKLKISKSYIHELKSDEKNKYKILSKWEGLLRGHTAFILGNAPGVEEQDLKSLDPYFTIGINRIFYIYDPTILLWQDRQIWNSNKKILLKQKAIKVCATQADPRKYFLNFTVKSGYFHFNNDPSVLYGKGNTGAIAAQFAVALGCSNIVLLGMDCKYGSKGKTDFYGKNKDHKPYTLKMCRGAMKWLKDNCPVAIYNCSDNELWPTRKLSTVIKEINPPMIGREEYRRIFVM
jgi:hypothetical protein